ncbi:uncharacterized protein LOC112452837 [Temnothorax curvispinosus]|uniref:Uncharacterized protein LOC112452837 n=1 Tax=Temnothorax curvispinosus TaxID=300111 RepID=A0A6J1PHG4_9HYME|nr:uncharacterized protein LOC112452837 [Temnothorax curvispinosus]
MERFRNLDWYPALEDMIDNVFIRDERMERESAMYRIMNDCFTDPFDDIKSDYADVDVELIKKYLREDGEVLSSDTEDKDEQEVEHGSNTRVQKHKFYVPGIRKLPFYFPKRSRLNKEQQTMCLRVLLRLSSNERKGMNDEERKELQEYMALQETISEEQKEFLVFAKSKWDDSFPWLIKCNKFVALKWKAKMQEFKKLPRFYAESMNIPLSVQKNNFRIKAIKVTFISCLREGTFSKVTLPKLDLVKVSLFTNHDELFRRFPVCIAPDNVTQHFRLPVSEDSYCESLAREADADFVISSSGLKCLLNNIDPDYSNSWLIPVVVKSHHGKNIVYVNKRLPPSAATIPQKNTWVYKYVLRQYFVDVERKSSEETKHMKKEDKSEKAANSDTDSNDSTFYNYLNNFEEDLALSDPDEPGHSDNPANGETDFKMDMKQNVSYKLFTIGPAESPQHERIKHGVKEYQMLVRTKTDGIEMLPNGKSEFLILAPRMEHQTGLGAEAVTLEEGLHQWASLKFRPDTSLARVRIETNTAEVIQIERLTTMSLSNEMKRLYNVKVEDSLSVLYNIIEGLASLAPGQYILRHVPQNGPFAYVYKQTEEIGKDVIDLHTVCESTTFHTIPKTPWPPIDNMMTTPALRCFKRMPAMFNPFVPGQKMSGRPRGRPKKIVTDNQVPTSVRRSGRLKETNKKLKKRKGSIII